MTNSYFAFNLQWTVSLSHSTYDEFNDDTENAKDINYARYRNFNIMFYRYNIMVR